MTEMGIQTQRLWRFGEAVPPSEPTIVDTSGNTTYYGVFVGANDGLKYAEKDAKDMKDAVDKWPGWKEGNEK